MNSRTMISSTAPAAPATQPLRVVLHESHSSTKARPEYVTHVETLETGGYCWGHYFTDWAEAVKDYLVRCEKYGVKP